MEQANAPTHLHTPLLTKAELRDWLKVSDMWIRMRVDDDPEFKARGCVIDIATPDSSRRTLRFPARAVAEYLGIPEYATPQLRGEPARAAA
ncbi:hypothetical protein ABZT16_11285 [Streptomyces flaveolus]|uniref:hypothetical protein n=1 Tax=Streptomyces flaveolus TaxID=67297 RepID=UPI0033A8801A